MMYVCVSIVTEQNTTRNEKEREGGKQSSQQHKSSNMQTASLKTHTHIQRKRDDDVDKYNFSYDWEKNG
jgi:hypothetical protein